MNKYTTRELINGIKRDTVKVEQLEDGTFEIQFEFDELKYPGVSAEEVSNQLKKPLMAQIMKLIDEER